MDARDAAARDGSERGDTEPFLAVRGSVARVRLWAGFAAFVAWINLLFCFEGLLRDQVAYGGGVIHDPLFLAATLAAALLLLASPRIGRSAVRRRAARRGVAESGDSGEAEGPVRLSPRRLALWSVAGAVAGVAGVVLSAARPSRMAMPFAWWPRWRRCPGCGPVHRPASRCALGRRRRRRSTSREVLALAVMWFAFCVQWLPLHCRGVRRRLWARQVACGRSPSPVLGMVPARVRGGRRPRRAKTREAPRLDAAGSWRESRLDPDRLPHCRARCSAFRLVIQFVWTCHIVAIDVRARLTKACSGRCSLLVFGPSFGMMVTASLALMNRWAHVPHGAVLSQRRSCSALPASCALGVLRTSSCCFSYTVVYAAYALIVPTMWVLAMERRVHAEGIDPARVFGTRLRPAVPRVLLARFVRGEAGAVPPWAQRRGPQALLPGLSAWAPPWQCSTVRLRGVVLPERTPRACSRPRLVRAEPCLACTSVAADIAAHYTLTARETEVFALLGARTRRGLHRKGAFHHPQHREHAPQEPLPQAGHSHAAGAAVAHRGNARVTLPALAERAQGSLSGLPPRSRSGARGSQRVAAALAGTRGGGARSAGHRSASCRFFTLSVMSDQPSTRNTLQVADGRREVERGERLGDLDDEGSRAVVVLEK